jgi:hypothetical protein
MSAAGGVSFLDIPLEELFGVVERVPDALDYMPRRATADCWYDFGFQRCAVLEFGQAVVIEAPDQGSKYDLQMLALWGAHCRSSAVVVRF